MLIRKSIWDSYAVMGSIEYIKNQIIHGMGQIPEKSCFLRVLDDPQLVLAVMSGGIPQSFTGLLLNGVADRILGKNPGVIHEGIFIQNPAGISEKIESVVGEIFRRIDYPYEVLEKLYDEILV